MTDPNTDAFYADLLNRRDIERDFGTDAEADEADRFGDEDEVDD